MVYKSFDELEAAVMQKAHKCKVAVVEAADEHVLEAVRHAVEVGLVEPLLFGKREDIAAKLKAIGLPGDPPQILLGLHQPAQSGILCLQRAGRKIAVRDNLGRPLLRLLQQAATVSPTL